MTLPEKPLSRKEQYLKKIATGEGELPSKPLSRSEQYLDYICKNGGLGGSAGGAVEFPNDWGVIAPTVPTIVKPTASTGVNFIAFSRLNGEKVFSDNFLVDTNSLRIGTYYLPTVSNSFDFSKSTYYKSGYLESKSNINIIYTNVEDQYKWLVEFGYNAILLSDDNSDDSQDSLFNVQQLRGYSSEIAEYMGKEGQIVINMGDNSIHVMDGVTPGGYKIAPVSATSQANITDLEERVLKLESIISSMQL